MKKREFKKEKSERNLKWLIIGVIMLMFEILFLTTTLSAQVCTISGPTSIEKGKQLTFSYEVEKDINRLDCSTDKGRIKGIIDTTNNKKGSASLDISNLKLGDYSIICLAKKGVETQDTCENSFKVIETKTES